MFQDKKEEFQANKRNIQKLLQNSTNTVWRVMQHRLDTLKYLPVFRSVYKKIIKDSEDLAQFYLDQINEHKKSINFEMDDEQTYYVEAFLKYRHKLETSGQKDHTFT